VSPPSVGGTVVLDGRSLTLEDLVRVARDPRVKVELAEDALERVRIGWKLIENIARRYERGYRAFKAGETDDPPVQDYGVTTGFGEFKDVPVAPDRLEELQRNILLSHAVGIGNHGDEDDPSNYFSAEVVRAALLIRCNAFLSGHSGVREETVRTVAAMLDHGIVPRVPLKGSLGSSGDLCPLAHLFVVLLGEGEFSVVTTPEEVTARVRPMHPASALADHLPPWPEPSYKEGLALVNGATFSAAALAIAVHDTEALTLAADGAAALSLEAMCGCARAFDPKVHAVRGLPGQQASADTFRRLLTGSKLLESAGAVQDVYSLRCAPAVHGATRDAVAYAGAVLEYEINAATDNPLFFPGPDGESHAGEPWDFQFRDNWPEGYRGDWRHSYSAGNFHGQPLGLAADFLAMAVAELANISERRTQLLLDHHHNRGLPANLIPERGVNSGFMLAQYSAASVVSENKVLCHPASVDSIPSSANSEDHVAMSTLAARKLLRVVANVQAVLAVELLVAAQAVEWRAGMGVRPRPKTVWLRREAVENPREAASLWQSAADELERFAALATPEGRERVAGELGRGTAALYRAVREVAQPMLRDRPLSGDIAAVRRALAGGAIASVLDTTSR
jgi:histidine ammonia-lyase